MQWSYTEWASQAFWLTCGLVFIILFFSLAPRLPVAVRERLAGVSEREAQRPEDAPRPAGDPETWYTLPWDNYRPGVRAADYMVKRLGLDGNLPGGANEPKPKSMDGAQTADGLADTTLATPVGTASTPGSKMAPARELTLKSGRTVPMSLTRRVDTTRGKCQARCINGNPCNRWATTIVNGVATCERHKSIQA